MKLPKIDLKKLDREMKRNREERLEFVEKYAEWMKNQKGNKKWSEQQKQIID